MNFEIKLIDATVYAYFTLQGKHVATLTIQQHSKDWNMTFLDKLYLDRNPDLWAKVRRLAS